MHLDSVCGFNARKTRMISHLEVFILFYFREKEVELSDLPSQLFPVGNSTIRLHIKPIMKRKLSYRPPISAIQSGDFDGITTNRTDFIRKEASLPLTFRPQRSHLLLDGIMDGITTTQADFDQKKTEKYKVIAIRPASHVVDRNQPFHGNTTYKDGYISMRGDRQKSFKPEEELHLSNATFDGTTTQKADFTRKRVDICPAEKVLTRDKSYEFVGTRRGHDFYHHRVTHGNRQNSNLVPVA
uniref:Uncharacterized protein n=1 Tax=Heterorhabditis bacteriophora TaxID=37862 RepID=A0A1I7W7J7_HETBA